MITNKEKDYRDKLFKLMQENPDLPVIPVVDANLCGDGYALYMGSWGSARVDEYIIPSKKDYLRLKSDGDVFDVLYACLSRKDFDALPQNESDCRPYYDALPWVKAIIVYINRPDCETQ